MLKQFQEFLKDELVNQPPSGGCVLKQPQPFRTACIAEPAAFRRLCVETNPPAIFLKPVRAQPPSGGCVLKQQTTK